MNKEKHDAGRFRYPKELYVKSPEEMQKAFEDLPEGREHLTYCQSMLGQDQVWREPQLQWSKSN